MLCAEYRGFQSLPHRSLVKRQSEAKFITDTLEVRQCSAMCDLRRKLSRKQQGK